MRTKTRTRLYRAAQETAGEARHDADWTGEELEKALKLSETRRVGEAAEILQNALGEHLAALAQELSDAEEQEYRRRDRARGLRKLREEQASELSNRLVRSRGAVAVFYGAPAVRKYFGRGKTPRRPDLLVDLAQRVVARLRREGPAQGGAKIPGSVLDAPELAAHLEEALTPLEVTLDELLRLEVQAGSYLLTKKRLERQLEHAQQDAARILGGMYRLAGQERRHERVRKTHARRRLRRKSRAGASAKASLAHRSSAGAPGTGAEALRFSDGAPGTACSLPESSAGAPETRSTVPASASGAPGTRSTVPASASGAPGTRSTVSTSAAGAPGTPSSPRESSSGAPVTPSALPGSRSGAVSERCATDEPSESAVLEQNAHGTGAWHPVRRRRATGGTASHPVPERRASGETASPTDPREEAHDVAA